MAVTLQQIAERVGVSRGTVDRALNNRGRINPEVAEKIKQAAQEMGYQPNRAGRALALSGRSVTIGVLIQNAYTPFMKQVVQGAMDAKKEAESFGAHVIVKRTHGVDVEETCEALKKLHAAGCEGIALTPVNERRVLELLRQYAEEGIQFVTFNSDSKRFPRLCFVGQDAMQSGKTAAALMAELLPAGTEVLIISGSPSVLQHQERVRGFQTVMRKYRKDVRVLEVAYAEDQAKKAEQITEKVLSAHPELGGIYLAAGGAESVCDVLERHGRNGEIKVISNDLTAKKVQKLKQGTIQFLIGQDAHVQGYLPVMILFARLFDGREPEQEYNYTEITIKNRYNI